MWHGMTVVQLVLIGSQSLSWRLPNLAFLHTVHCRVSHTLFFEVILPLDFKCLLLFGFSTSSYGIFPVFSRLLFQPCFLHRCLVVTMRLGLSFSFGSLLMLRPDVLNSLPCFKAWLKRRGARFSIGRPCLRSRAGDAVSLVHYKHKCLLLCCYGLIGRQFSNSAFSCLRNRVVLAMARIRQTIEYCVSIFNVVDGIKEKRWGGCRYRPALEFVDLLPADHHLLSLARRAIRRRCGRDSGQRCWWYSCRSWRAGYLHGLFAVVAKVWSIGLDMDFFLQRERSWEEDNGEDIGTFAGLLVF